MKICSGCGRENADDAARCHECGAEFPVPSAAAIYVLRPWMKWGLYFAAWGAVVVVTLARNPRDLLTAPGFPIGLLAILPGEEMAITAWLAGLFVIGAGWIGYGILTYVLKTTKSTSVFFLVYIIFGVLLALNVVGCGVVIKTIGGIH